MSTNDNLASESDETRSDNEVQGACMPTSGVSFHFAYTLTFLTIHVYVKVEVKILGFPILTVMALLVLGF
jgi:hypothetical protein